jgi:hypothetical protein
MDITSTSTIVTYPGWWYTSSVGMMKFQIPNIWKNKIHVPNHQPDGHLINNNGDLTNNGR